MSRRQKTLPVLRGASQMLATLPHLLGYQPERSLVLCASLLDRSGPPTPRPQAPIALTLRVDLPPIEAVRGYVAQLRAPLARAALRPDLQPSPGVGDRRAPDPVLLVHAFVYDAADDLALALAEELMDQLAEDESTYLHDFLVVRDERFQRVVQGGEDVDGSGLSDESCWSPLPSPADVPAVADLVLDGSSPVRRSDIVDWVRQQDETQCGATDLAIDVLELDPSRFDPVEALGAFGQWVVQGGEEPSIRQRAWIACALQDRMLRDVVLARWLPEIFSAKDCLVGQEERAVHDALPAPPATFGPMAPGSSGPMARILHLTARTPTDLTPPLLTIAAALAWREGGGTVGNELVALALEREPDYRMAQLVQHALASPVRPWQRARADQGEVWGEDVA